MNGTSPNYAEADEVGNVRDRIAYVAGWGQGFRMAKVAAAGTLLSRGIPMAFMGAEAGRTSSSEFGSSATLDLDMLPGRSGSRGSRLGTCDCGGLVQRSKVPRRLMFALLMVNCWPFREVSAVTTSPSSTLGDGREFTTLATSICLMGLIASSGTRPGRHLQSLAKTRASTPMEAATPARALECLAFRIMAL